jgi:hypothetical protein
MLVKVGVDWGVRWCVVAPETATDVGESLARAK